MRGERWSRFHASNVTRALINLLGSRGVAVSTTRPALATGVILVSPGSRSMIGPNVHRPDWAMGVDPALLPFSRILPLKDTVPHQLIFYNIPKFKEQKNVST